MTTFMQTAGAKFWDWVDGRSVVRRSVLFTTLYTTVEAFKWGAAYANTTPLSGTDAALIIAAVTAPITVLQGFTFKWYGETRTKADEV
jgi:hypothetical protein